MNQSSSKITVDAHSTSCQLHQQSITSAANYNRIYSIIYYLNDDDDLCSPADIVAQPDPLVRPLLHQAGVGVHDELEDLGPLQT